MHFDEVYHARTATEFLQDWRYGIVARHLRVDAPAPRQVRDGAAGIVAFAGHDVASTERPRRPGPRRGRRAAPGRPVRTGRPSRRPALGRDRQRARRLRPATARRSTAAGPSPGASAVAFDDDEHPGSSSGTDAGEVLALDAHHDGLVRGTPTSTETVVAPAPSPRSTARSRARGVPGRHARGGGHRRPAWSVVDLDTGETGRAVPRCRAIIGLARSTTSRRSSRRPSRSPDPRPLAARARGQLGGDGRGRGPRSSTRPRTRRSRSTSVLDARDNRRRSRRPSTTGSSPGLEFQAVPTMAVAGADGVTLPRRSTATVASTSRWSRRAGPRAGHRRRRRQPAVRHDLDDVDRRPAAGRRHGRPGSAETRPQRVDAARAAGPRHDASCTTARPSWSRSWGRRRTARARRSTWSSRTARACSPITGCRSRRPPWPSTTTRTTRRRRPGAAARVRRRRRDRVAGRRARTRSRGGCPGVIIGALTVGRAVPARAGPVPPPRRRACWSALFALLDGMFFVQSRIAMNDVYVGFFILAAYLVFAWLWLDPRRRRGRSGSALPTMGVLLGLALASKWVAAYAIGALGILVLMRSRPGPDAADRRDDRGHRRAGLDGARRARRQRAAPATCRSC